MDFYQRQNRGTGDTYNFKTQDGKGQTIGAVYENFEDCILDFESLGYIFLYLKGYKKVVLIGHSFATQKIAYFMKIKQHPMVYKIVFPFSF